jgi:hypothetical protein
LGEISTILAKVPRPVRVEVLADGELSTKYGLSVAAGFGRTSGTDTERGRAQNGEGLALEAFVNFVKDLKDLPEVGTILSLAAFVLNNLVLLLYFDQLPSVGAADILSGAGRGKRQGHS